MENSITMKTCTKCHRELPISEFYKNHATRDGYDTYCKECKTESNTEAKRNSKHLRSLVKELQAENESLRQQLISKKDKDLSAFEGIQLLSELKRRGYVWKDMVVTKSVDYNKI